ncbi:hypothetical protein GAN17_10980 [Mycobacterium kubicae]|uniref:GtrA family protein n=1 Tax=Mycobacterium kubicae TaxID=120959 RepID=UPI001641D445|nr:GtrA family protein [Mycobacterium kubicae]QNI06760.1 hypothetical protein GAN17_10980 [Mycobacterium kubicae]
MVLATGAIAESSMPDVRKKLRYVAVALVFLPIGQGLIQLLGPYLHDYAAASLIAASLTTVPNFFANKRFVWRNSPVTNVRHQVMVFWVVVMLAVLLATTFTDLVQNAMVDRSTLVRGASVLGVQVIGFGIVWVGRFMILDRWFFRSKEHPVQRSGDLVGAVSA